METQRTIFIGRNTEAYQKNDVHIEDALVSREHLKATLISEKKVELTDLGSTNGTYVNNRRLIKDKPVIVGPADSIALAKLELVVDPFSYLLPKREADASSKRAAANRIAADPLDRSEEFDRIEATWYEMTEMTKKMKRKFQMRMSLIGGLSAFAPSIFILLFAKDSPDLMRMSGMITGAAVTMTGLYRIKPEEKLQDKMRVITESLRDIYKCPGTIGGSPCKVVFNYAELPERIRKQKKCHSCNAKYVKEQN